MSQGTARIRKDLLLGRDWSVSELRGLHSGCQGTDYSFVGHVEKFGFNCTRRKLTTVLKAGEQQSSTL